MKRTIDERKRDRLKRWEERQERSKVTREQLHQQIEDVNALRDELDGDDKKEVRTFSSFSDLPISERTRMGLERGNYFKMTPIQSESIPIALVGKDILGAAKTGSGKTLSFLVPMLERLLLERWDGEAGVGALVLSPTRELALQIFKVLQVIGYKHTFSAALLIGGRDVAEERKRLQNICIVIATPGRLVHHLKEGAELSLENLQVLVLDEADRLLDMGFRDELLAIIEHLPKEKQTLLFSATQTADVKMLAKMSLASPQYVSAHAASATPTPTRMCQNFIMLELHRKLDALLAFIKRHPNDKIVVFANTCNQVKFMYLAFSKILKKMRIPSMCLTGKMKQFRREEVFLTYCRCKSAVLFCTDVAARGLDFPMIHYVIQYDCPDSAQTYIHRAGRTARAGARGVSILFLTPSEAPMLSFLAHKQVPLREIRIKSHLLSDTRDIFVALVVQGLKYEAQKAFIAFLRSVHFAANKVVFDVTAIDVEKFANSLGLMSVPSFSDFSSQIRGAKNLPWDVINYLQQRQSSNEGPAATLTRKERHLQASDMFRQLQTKQRFAGASTIASAFDDDEDVIVKKERQPVTKDQSLTFDERVSGLSKNKRKQIVEAADLRIKDLKLSRRTVFDEDKDASDGFESDEIDSDDENDFKTSMASRLRVNAGVDRENAKSLRRQRRLKRDGRLQDVNESSDDEEPRDQNDSDSNESTMSDGMAQLIKAAKGELYPADPRRVYKKVQVQDSDGDDLDGNCAPPPEKRRR